MPRMNEAIMRLGIGSTVVSCMKAVPGEVCGDGDGDGGHVQTAAILSDIVSKGRVTSYDVLTSVTQEYIAQNPNASTRATWWW